MHTIHLGAGLAGLARLLGLGSYSSGKGSRSPSPSRRGQAFPSKHSSSSQAQHEAPRSSVLQRSAQRRRESPAFCPRQDVIRQQQTFLKCFPRSRRCRARNNSCRPRGRKEENLYYIPKGEKGIVEVLSSVYVPGQGSVCGNYHRVINGHLTRLSPDSAVTIIIGLRVYASFPFLPIKVAV